AVGMAEVERDAAFPKVAHVEERGLLVELRILMRTHRRAEPNAVGTLHGLDLDDVGAHRAQPGGSERTGPKRGEIEHRERGKGSLAHGDRDRRVGADWPGSVGSARRRKPTIGNVVKPKRGSRANPGLARLLYEDVARDEMVETRQLG